MPATLRLAVAQTTVPDDPADVGALRESGAQIRSLMRDAHASDATLAQFPEGAVVYPSKRVVSSAGPAELAEADWTRADWDVIRAEAEAIAALAAQLGSEPCSAPCTRSPRPAGRTAPSTSLLLTAPWSPAMTSASCPIRSELDVHARH